MNRILKISFRSIAILFLAITVFQSTASARTIFVSPSGNNDTGASWETAFTTISAGLTASASGDEIWVHSATYTESIEMKEGVALYGGFTGSETNREERNWDENETVIDADGLDSSVVIGANAAVLDGFTVTGGGYDWSDAGLYCMGTSPTIDNCTITRNPGSGVYCEKASPKLIHCNITKNYEDGVFCQFASPQLDFCLIEGNEGMAGVNCIEDSSPMLMYCTIRGGLMEYSTPSGVYCVDSEAFLQNCIITNHSGGGIVGRFSSFVLNNCLIADNFSEYYSGGLSLEHASYCTLINCTIANNSSKKGVGGITVVGYSLSLTNCILWNTGEELNQGCFEEDSVRYCCIQGGWPGEGNIDADPLFANPDEGHYNLRYTSPCIDRGLVSFSSSYDMNNQPRPGSDGLVDIGAYEVHPALTPGPANHEPTHFYVRSDVSTSGDGTSWATAFSSISSALEVTSTSDEIWVQGGTYTEAILMEPAVALFGGFSGSESVLDSRNWHLNKTVIDATGLDRSAVIGAHRASLDGFIITGGNIDEGGGVFCRDNSPKLSNCEIVGNAADYSGGGLICVSSSPRLYNCLISGNRVEHEGGGVFCRDYSSPSFFNCIISGNSSGAGSGGIYLDQTSLPTLINCILWNRGLEIRLTPDSTPDVQYCCVQGGWPGGGNIDAAPMFIDAASGDYHLQDGSPCIDRGLVSAAPAKDLDGVTRPGSDGLVDMGAYESPSAWEPGPAIHVPTRWYVRAGASSTGDGTSWETAFPSLTSVLDVAGVSDEIWVQSGVYREAIAMEPGVALFGGFAGSETARDQRDRYAKKSVIDAEGLNRAVVVGADNTILDGFIITGGYQVYNFGAGMRFHQSTATVNDCIITDNYAEGGGGVFLDRATLKFTGCQITNNNATFNGGGLLAYDGASVIMENCILKGNCAGYDGGGIFYSGDSQLLVNCEISGNKAGWEGAGGSFRFSSSSFEGCTIVDNKSDMSNGGLSFNYKSIPTLTNCIVWNDGDEFAGDATQDLIVTYSCIEGGWPGERNIDSDPMFVRSWDGESGDYRLRLGSPCIDSGTDVPELSVDLAGLSRPVDIPGVEGKNAGDFDRGAYERQMFDVGDVRSAAFLVYSALWHRGEDSAPLAMNETEYRAYNAWSDDTIDWKDIITTLDVGRD